MSEGAAVALAIFALTYTLVATRRWEVLPVGRPGGALLGAVAMVAFGVHTPDSAWRSLDGDTLGLVGACTTAASLLVGVPVLLYTARWW